MQDDAAETGPAPSEGARQCQNDRREIKRAVRLSYLQRDLGHISDTRLSALDLNGAPAPERRRSHLEVLA